VRVTIDPGLPVALAVALLLTLTVTKYLVGRLPQPRSTLFAAARAIVQLSIAALVIAAVIKSLVLSLLLLTFMFVIAVVTTVRRVEAPKAWPWATLAMLTGLLPVVLIILLTRTVPPTGIALVPVVGILAGNTMNGHTLTCRRAFAALREEKGQYEAALSLGLTRAQSVGEVVHRRVPEALIPGLDQVRTAGATRVGDQIKFLTKFIYLLGGATSNIASVDESIRRNQAGPDAAQKNSAAKAQVRSGIEGFREALDKLEIDFRNTPELQPYYIKLAGVAAGAADAEQKATTEQFDAAGRSLLGVVNRLTDVLLLMRY